mmetsp:Transcript_78039/g.126565  ORF Transcript_78039/g.126565 Transcript_78039/m.126565 type:complete len:84 (+) Transcript_78039:32-283(+)
MMLISGILSKMQMETQSQTMAAPHRSVFVRITWVARGEEAPQMVLHFGKLRTVHTYVDFCLERVHFEIHDHLDLVEVNWRVTL